MDFAKVGEARASPDSFYVYTYGAGPLRLWKKDKDLPELYFLGLCYGLSCCLTLVPFQMLLLLPAVSVCLSLFPCLYYKPQALLSIWTNAIALAKILIWAEMPTWEVKCTSYKQNTHKIICKLHTNQVCQYDIRSRGKRPYYIWIVTAC